MKHTPISIIWLLEDKGRILHVSLEPTPPKIYGPGTITGYVLKSSHEELLEAAKAVIVVADRKTVEFDNLKKAIAKAERK